MGNREALLEGAKQCLLEKGYTRTTARDIASAAGVSLAAIGYHFSSKEALMTEALVLAFGDWSEEFRRLVSERVPANASPVARFELTWVRMIESFEMHRSLWAANMELFSQMHRMPEIRAALGENLRVARVMLTSVFLNREPEAISDEMVRTVGKFHHVLLSGLIAQWLISAEDAPTARELTEGLLQTAKELARPGKNVKAKGGRGGGVGAKPKGKSLAKHSVVKARVRGLAGVRGRSPLG